MWEAVYINGECLRQAYISWLFLDIYRLCAFPAKLHARKNCEQIQFRKYLLHNGSGSFVYQFVINLTYSTQQRPWDANQFSATQEILLINGTRDFITVFTITRLRSLPWTSSIQSIPTRPTSWRSILILSSNLCLGLPSGGVFPSRFLTKIFHATLMSSVRATCSAWSPEQ